MREIQTGLDAAFPENRDISPKVAPTGHFSGTATKEPPPGIERWTPSLPKTCSAVELWRHIYLSAQLNVVRSRTSDLNPPLGRPGGPCYVVRRIDDAVTSPALKTKLVDKVEEGEDLSNPEAASVYELEAERTRGLFPRLYIGPHAQYRMDLRGVTVRNLQDAMEELAKVFHAARKTRDMVKLRPFEAFASGQKLEYVTRTGLQVVLAPRPGGAQVVTTFWKGRPDPSPPGQCDPMARRVAARFARRTILRPRRDSNPWSLP